MIELVFESEFAGADDAAVVAAIEENNRAEAVAGARRLAAIAELARRRVDDDDERANWVFDGWASAAAEVAAAMTVGHRRASGQMRIAVAGDGGEGGHATLRDRLPRVAALYWQGAINSRVVSTITWRTQLVDDGEALALIDAALADSAARWGTLSEQKLDDAIDARIDRFDPDAVRRTESSTRSRDFSIGDLDDPAGVTSVWGRLLATDAAVLKGRIAAMVAAVCDADPRSAGERRADAVSALLAGSDKLGCACGSDTCPAVGARPASSVVVHVIAEQQAVAAATPSPDDSAAKPPATPSAALIVGGTVLPAAVLKEVIGGGATVTPIGRPANDPEPRYRPSAGLAQFVRMRDLFCRAPGCDVSADRCDVDHTTPYPIGPTHASNLKCLCRLCRRRHNVELIIR